MHFFNPAYAMKLVEVVQTPQTSEETKDSIVDFSQKIAKIPLVVKDTPGFVVNRILMPAINSAAFVLMENVATAETIDTAMKLGANYPMGPLALADLIGIDTCLKIMTEFCEKLEHADYQICPLFPQMVADGNLGRKTGKGFFVYNEISK
jgi:3-hydroxybutyryl-CoA dehydrogenase